MTDRVHAIVWLVLLALGIVLSGTQLVRDEPKIPSVHIGHHHGSQHEPQRIFFWEPQQVKTLILKDTHGREQKYTRDARGQLTSAHRLATDSFNAQAYVSLLSSARIDREFPANRESLYAFGLAPALLRIVAMDDGGSVLVDLTVGDQTPDGFGRYIMVPGDSNVLIIPDYQVKEALRALQTGI